MTFDEVLVRFDAKKSGDGYMAHCPVHKDSSPSLSLNPGTNGNSSTVLKCQAGCATDAVLSAVGLTLKDLFSSTNGNGSRAFWAPERFVAAYVYRDETGAPLYESVRLKDPKDFRARRDSSQRPWSIKGIRRVLYRLNELQGKTTVFDVEGEKDANRLWTIGIAATTNVFGADKWSDEYTKQLQAAGVVSVVILPDNDDPGRAHAVTVAQSCYAAGLAVTVVTLPDLPAKGDVSDYLDAGHSAADLLAECERATPWTPETPTIILQDETAAAPSSPTAYTFAPAFPSGHFVTTWIEHFSKQCDAALEFHEAAALVALAQATPSLNARISGSADGLHTNLYLLFVGRAGITRKSTAKDYAVKTLRRALPNVLLPEQMTQESFVESLTKCNGGAALWAIDEFTDTLSKMVNATYLAGMRGLLLELYARTDYTYRRVSKGAKKTDGERLEDAFSIRDVTLSLIGCATPTIFQNLDNTAVGSGLLTRFAIVMPESKPARLPQYELTGEAIPSGFVTKLHSISIRTAKQTVTFAPGVLERLDEAIDKPLDESADRCQMTVRMGVMARKVAMLSAAGRKPAFGDDVKAPSLVVALEDADAAIKVVTRWIGYAQAFEARTDESAFEVNVQRCVALAKGRTVNRRTIAKLVHVPAKVMTEIEQTLIQRGEIEVLEHRPSTGRPSYEWKWVE